MYPCESFTSRKTDETHVIVRAFEMKTLKIDIESVMQTNKWVIEKAEMERSVMESTVSRKLSSFGHIARKSRDCSDCQSTISGRRAQGRPRRAWLYIMKSWTGLALEEVLRATEDHQQWRKIVHDAVKHRIVEGKARHIINPFYKSE